MQLESQLVNLELSKKLKELKVKQDSLFVWDENGECLVVLEEEHKDNDYSAFTVAELGNMLPWRLRGFVLRAVMNVLNEKDSTKQWELTYWEEGREDEMRFDIITDETEANARASMLIYLLENELISLS